MRGTAVWGVWRGSLPWLPHPGQALAEACGPWREGGRSSAPPTRARRECGLSVPLLQGSRSPGSKKATSPVAGAPSRRHPAAAAERPVPPAQVPLRLLPLLLHAQQRALLRQLRHQPGALQPRLRQLPPGLPGHPGLPLSPVGAPEEEASPLQEDQQRVQQPHLLQQRHPGNAVLGWGGTQRGAAAGLQPSWELLLSPPPHLPCARLALPFESQRQLEPPRPKRALMGRTQCQVKGSRLCSQTNGCLDRKGLKAAGRAGPWAAGQPSGGGDPGSRRWVEASRQDPAVLAPEGLRRASRHSGPRGPLSSSARAGPRKL